MGGYVLKKSILSLKRYVGMFAGFAKMESLKRIKNMVVDLHFDPVASPIFFRMNKLLVASEPSCSPRRSALPSSRRSSP